MNLSLYKNNLGVLRTVNGLTWIKQGENVYKAVINANWYVWASTLPPATVYHIVGPPGQMAITEWQVNEKLNNGFFDGKLPDKQIIQQQTTSNGNGIKTKLSDDTDLREKILTTDTGGMFGLSNTQLLLIGIAVIAVIYFIKK